jgi:hypothetical protein
MSDLGFSWLDLLVLGPLIAPWLAVPGAVLLATVWYRRTRSVYQTFAAAGAGLFLAPFALFLLGFLSDRGSKLGESPARAGVLLGAAALAAVTVVLFAVQRAGARRRRPGP